MRFRGAHAPPGGSAHAPIRPWPHAAGPYISQPPATAGRIVTSSPFSTSSVEAVEEPDVLAADVHVDEPSQSPVLRDPAAELAVALVERVEHLADGRTLDLGGRVSVGGGTELGRNFH